MRRRSQGVARLQRRKKRLVNSTKAPFVYQVVLVTAGTERNAKSIAKVLVKKKLAACVNLLPGLTSVYRWKGKVLSESEWLLVIKSRRADFRRIQDAVRAVHTYETPEIIGIPLTSGEPNYLKWLAEETDHG
jgi:periplasmic divalent cation tolerance protein